MKGAREREKGRERERKGERGKVRLSTGSSMVWNSGANTNRHMGYERTNERQRETERERERERRKERGMNGICLGFVLRERKQWHSCLTLGGCGGHGDI